MTWALLYGQRTRFTIHSHSLSGFRNPLPRTFYQAITLNVIISAKKKEAKEAAEASETGRWLKYGALNKNHEINCKVKRIIEITSMRTTSRGSTD